MSFFETLPASLTAPVPIALNHLLRQEKWALEKLRAHAGKVACFDIGGVSLSLRVDGDGLLSMVTSDEASKDSPSVRIIVRAAELPLILQQPDTAFSRVRIDGDADFANTISQVAKGVKWDVADDLGRVVGDVAAGRIVGGASTGVASLKQVVQKFLENTAEYFLEEKPMLVRPVVVADFTQDVTRLRDDVERLSKRIERLT